MHTGHQTGNLSEHKRHFERTKQAHHYSTPVWQGLLVVWFSLVFDLLNRVYVVWSAILNFRWGVLNWSGVSLWITDRPYGNFLLMVFECGQTLCERWFQYSHYVMIMYMSLGCIFPWIEWFFTIPFKPSPFLNLWTHPVDHEIQVFRFLFWLLCVHRLLWKAANVRCYLMLTKKANGNGSGKSLTFVLPPVGL